MSKKSEKIVSLQQKNPISMGESFTETEKTAIANVLYNLAYADFNTHQGEDECLKTCLGELGFDAAGFVPVERNLLQVKAYETLKRMSKEKKKCFSLMMTQLSRSDGHFGPREQAFVKEILVMCEVPFVHK